MTADTAVAHGYTVRDLEHFTRLVLRMDRWYTAGDIEERYDAVWFGITEYLLTADEPPTRRGGPRPVDLAPAYCTTVTGSREAKFRQLEQLLGASDPHGVGAPRDACGVKSVD